MRWPTLLFRLLLAGLLLPAVGLTALRVVSPEQGLLVRWTSFAPVAIPLYVVAVVLVLGRLLLMGRESRRARAAVAAVAAVGLGLHAWWISPQFAGSAAEPAEDGPRLQVMTMNLFEGAADASQVVQTAARERVDILVLQEVTPDGLRELERFGLTEAYPYRGGEPREGVTGTMVFSTSRIREVERLDTTYDSWSMNVVTAQGQVRLYAVHTQPPLDDAAGWRKDLDALVDAAADDRELDLAVGDFNATPDHAPFRRFGAEADLHSASERSNSGWQPTWPDHGDTTFTGIPLPRLMQIDHVLVGRSMTATETAAFSIDGSDHRAVVAEVALRA